MDPRPVPALARRARPRAPWYWDTSSRSLDYYHHMVYASAYTYRATRLVRFGRCRAPTSAPGSSGKYPRTWPEFDPIWERVTERWREAGPEVEWHTHGLTPVGFCDAVPARAVRRHAEQQRGADARARGQALHLLLASRACGSSSASPSAMPRTATSSTRILAGEAPAQPDRARDALLRPAPRSMGQGRAARPISVAHRHAQGAWVNAS